MGETDEGDHSESADTAGSTRIPGRRSSTLSRSRSRSRQVVIPGKVPGLRKSSPWVPDEGAYEAIPKSESHETKMLHLGIDESLLRPSNEMVTGVFGQREARGLHELRSHKTWRPTQMRFKPGLWPEGELGNEWYEMVYLDLYFRTQKFAREYFGYSDIEEVPAWDSLWKQTKLENEFLYYASLVARQDKKTGGWETLLKTRLHRPLLVQGVVAKALQFSVFDKLMFGCDDDGETMLSSHDFITIKQEGKTLNITRLRYIAPLGLCPRPFFPKGIQLTAFVRTRLWTNRRS
jgi:hypothetical protein